MQGTFIPHHTRRFVPWRPRAAPRPPSPANDLPTGVAQTDELERLGDEIAMLAAKRHAAMHRLLVLIADFDRRRGWALDGQRSCAHWLAYRTGIDLGAAREKVRAARALERLPLTSSAMKAGALSFSKVRALTRVARPETEAALLELARGTTVEQLERIVRAYRDGAIDDTDRRALRTLSIFPGDDGLYEIRGRLTPEIGALVMRAIEAAADSLYHHNVEELVDSCREAAQRRADAIGLLAERALAAGFGSGPDSNAPISGTGAQRYQVLLHVSPATLSSEPSGDVSAETQEGNHVTAETPDSTQPSAETHLAELEDGTRVSAETCRRLTCDASVTRVTTDAGNNVLDVGRRTRTIPPALRRALHVRDRGCRFPGCGLRFTDAHHVRHWAQGGETSLANCLLLCNYHHTLVHEGGWRVEWCGEGRPVFIDPRGRGHSGDDPG